MGASGISVDGRKVDVESLRDREFRSSLREFNALAVLPKYEEAPLIQSFLDVSLPVLEHLSLDTELTDAQERSRDPPTFKLIARNLPMLQSLVVRHSFVRMDLPLVLNLRRLHLWHNYDMGNLRRLPIIPFLEMLRNCSLLEELWVGNYLDLSALPCDPGRLPVVSLATLTDLQSVTLEDEPAIVSTILSCFIVPAHVSVEVTGHISTDSEADPALRTMFPHDWNKLPLLHHATTIKVNDSQSQPCLTFQKGDVTFEILLKGESRYPFHWINRPLRSVFSSMISSVGLFRAIPVKTLRFAGNVTAVPQAHWIAAIAPFLDLEEISVDDVPELSMTSLSVFLPVLTHWAASQQRLVICPKLRRFACRGAVYDRQSIQEAIFGCFKQRVQRGARTLDKLHLQLFPHRAWTAAEAASLRQALEHHIAKTVVLEVYDRVGGGRSREYIPTSFVQHPGRD
ncbi:hypothetical protein OH77DRAFT_1420899 [Trametes cingulata]|nr:hypothetical protein OH77DRAFT_1420899 [Trametes cingulata]